MHEEMVLPLREANDVSLVGGKALALGELTRAGFKAPDGFVVTTHSQMTMSNELGNAILNAFNRLGSQYVAVRSSGVAEDSKESAWAGQFDTFLNATRENLIEKIQNCWESAQSERVRSYAAQRNTEVQPVAVIVQEMIQSEISGIAFSVNPISQNANEIMIEAGLGLGEAFVSGQITPDTYVVEKDTAHISDKHISTQTKKLMLNHEGLNEWEDAGILGTIEKLSDDHIKELAIIIGKLEAHFRYPVDVEWGEVDGRLYILQCRPITTLK